jgi:hypothetical protein
MSKGIKLSEKHGVNPAITVCFFCGKETGIAMLGKLKGDVKAPKRIVANYIPCEDCKKRMEQGRVVIEVVRKANGLPPIQPGAYPTGRWCLLNKESAKKLFKDGLDRPVLLEDTLYTKLVGKEG